MRKGLVPARLALVVQSLLDGTGALKPGDLD